MKTGGNPPDGPAGASPADDLAAGLGGRKFGTILADPPWRFDNRTGKTAPEHRRPARCGTLALESRGFQYKTNLIWRKIRKDGGPDGRGVGFYFRSVTEIILFGVRGKAARTLGPGRRQVNFIAARKREHSRKPDEQYELIEACSRGPYLELFARGKRENRTVRGDRADGRKLAERPSGPHIEGMESAENRRPER